MKGPLIKSGEQEQGQLILLLIRPDKAGVGQQRGVPDPTAPRAPQPSSRLAARPGFDRVCGTGCHLPAPVRLRVVPSLPWSWGESWRWTPLSFQQDLLLKG